MISGEPGLSGVTARGLSLVSKRNRRRRARSGEPGFSRAPRVVVEKCTRFSNIAEVYDIEDDGSDEFTFDNGIASQRIQPKRGKL